MQLLRREEITGVLRKARMLEMLGRRAAAEQLYRDHLQSAFCDGCFDFRIHFNLAQLLLKEHNSEENTNDTPEAEALSLFQSVIDLTDGAVPEAFVAASAILIKRGDPSSATNLCERGLQQHPIQSCSGESAASSEICFNLNIALRQLGRQSEAVSYSWNVFKDLHSLHGPQQETRGAEVPRIASPQLLATAPLSGRYSVIGSPVPVAGSTIVNCIRHITVVCVKWGTKYNAEYVNRLFNGLQRSYESSLTPLTFAMVCLTDDAAGIVDSVLCLPFPQDSTNITSSWRGWWLKAHLFSSAVSDALSELQKEHHPQEQCWVLYLDLDTVLCGPIDFLHYACDTDATEPFFTLNAGSFPSEGRPFGINSSIMMWPVGSHQVLHEFLCTHYTRITSIIYKFDHYLEMMFSKLIAPETGEAVRDDGAESNQWMRRRCRFLQELYEGKICDYSDYIRCSIAGVPIDDVRIVCFPLQPKPHQLIASESAASSTSIERLARLWQGSTS